MFKQSTNELAQSYIEKFKAIKRAKKDRPLTDKEEEKLLTGEEVYFIYWTCELMIAGLIEDISLPETIKIIPKEVFYYKDPKARKNTIKPRHLLHDLEYTADFEIEVSLRFLHLCCVHTSMKELPKQYLFYNLLSDLTISIEVKPDKMTVRNQNTSDILFPVKQKMIYHLFGKFINKVKIPSLFKDTFTPQQYLLDQIYKVNCKGGKKGTSKIKYKPVRNCDEWLDTLNK
jgi:hypothetical protein